MYIGTLVDKRQWIAITYFWVEAGQKVETTRLLFTPTKIINVWVA